MDFFSLLGRLLNIIWNVIHWRWNLCFWLGVVVGVIAVIYIPQNPLGLIVGAILFFIFVVIGRLWDARAQ